MPMLNIPKLDKCINMKKVSFVIDSAGNTGDLHTFRPIAVDYPGKDMRNSITSFMLMNSIKVLVFDYTDCLLTFRYRRCENRYPFAVVVEPYAAMS